MAKKITASSDHLVELGKKIKFKKKRAIEILVKAQSHGWFCFK